MREITNDGVIVIDEEALTGADVIEIMRSRDTYAGWKRDGDKRIAELEAALRAILALGVTSDPAEDSKAMRGIARTALGLPEPWGFKGAALSNTKEGETMRAMPLMERLAHARDVAMVEDKEAIEAAADRIAELEAALHYVRLNSGERTIRDIARAALLQVF
jgi:hypothetical protein